LLHYPYKNFSFYIEKWNRYNILIATQIKKDMERKNKFERVMFGIGYLMDFYSVHTVTAVLGAVLMFTGVYAFRTVKK